MDAVDGSGHLEPVDLTRTRMSTRAARLGRPAHHPDQPFNEPITMASVYAAGGEKEYGRYSNPTWSAFEEALGGLEGGRCLAYPSGLSAVATLLDLVGHGEVVVAPKHAYLGSLTQLGDLELRGRLKARLVDVTDTAAVAAACEDAALVWMESPTNPAMEVADLPAIAKAAHDAGARLVVDNTFATPVLQRPLELGADIVLHSVTKYIGGHSDLLMGAVVVSDEQLWTVLKQRRDSYGNTPGTLESWLALRGLRTLPLRVERAQASAQELARRLAERDDVVEVRYPGFGGMLALVLDSGPRADLVQHSTRLWVYATSLGGLESTLERRRRWRSEPETIPEGLLRLSVGVEDVDDLWDDLSRALDSARL